MLRLSTREDIKEALEISHKREKLVLGMATVLAKEAMHYHGLSSIDNLTELSTEEYAYYLDLAVQALNYLAD